MTKYGDRWRETSDVVTMFPTLVWKVELEAAFHEALDAEIFAALAKIRMGLPAVATGHAWQSAQRLHELEEFKGLANCIDELTRSVLGFLKIGCDDFEITGCWANILAPGASHRMHSHPNNYLSGAYYVRTGPGADTINFHDPRIQTGVIRPPVTELTSENTDQVVIKVKSGTLLMFPAYLQHSVNTNAGDGERISVSFNVMFSSFTEHLGRPLW